MTWETLCKVIATVIGGAALLIICGVVAAEAWATFEYRRHRRKPEADVSEIPDDPRERMVPKSWRENGSERS